MDTPTAVAPAPRPSVRIARPSPAVDAARRLAHATAGYAVLALVATVVALAGLDVRYWAWQSTEPIRYVLDIDNAFRQGTRTLATGYLERYDNNHALPAPPSWTPAGLDYAPGRLAIAALWTRWVRTQVAAPSAGPNRLSDQWYSEFYPYARTVGLTYQLCRPLLWVNLTGEALSAAAMFLLVRRYTSERGGRPVRGNVLGAMAATLFWFDPALLSNAHAWPQWDSWVLPFTLWALLLASLDVWFCAGLVIAAGAMFKGQILFGAALFLLWPLWQGRVGAMARWVAGLAFGVAVETAVWLVRSPGHLQGYLYVPGHTNPAAVRWVIDAAVAAALVLVAVRVRGSMLRRLTPPSWADWTDRDPSGRRVMVGVTAITGALAGAALTAVAAVWLAVVVSVGVGLIVAAAAVGLLAWAAWMTGVVPRGWPDRLATPPIAASVAVRLLVGVAAVVALVLPLRAAGVAAWWSAAGVGGLAILMACVPARSLGHVAAAWVAAALLLCIPLFGGGSQWFFTGIAHGTTARTGMSMGANNNLANLLQDVWGWQLEDPVITLPAGPAAAHVGAFLHNIDPHVAFPPGKPVSLPLKYLLLLIWVVLTVACWVGAARHDRRRDPRFLIAVAAPWVVMFAVMGQMHQRYLLWGAALTCMAAGVSPGLVLLHLLLSVVSAGQELASMAGHRDADAVARLLVTDAGRTNARWWVRTGYLAIHGWTPGMGWAVLLTAGVFVYVAVTPGRRGPRLPIGE